MLRALIWDVDGTVAETERDGHRVAFNQALEEQGAGWQWDVETYGALLRVAGGYERLIYDMEGRATAPTSAGQRESLARAVHDRKNTLYTEMVASGKLSARPGVERVMDECAGAGIALAIATTTGRRNVEALFAILLGPRWQDRFGAIVCAEDAASKKPDPLVYRLALERLGIDASNALAIEDSPNGLAAASAIGIGPLITRSQYFSAEPFPACAAICDDLDNALTWRHGRAARADIESLRSLHQAWVSERTRATTDRSTRSA